MTNAAGTAVDGGGRPDTEQGRAQADRQARGINRSLSRAGKI